MHVTITCSYAEIIHVPYLYTCFPYLHVTFTIIHQLRCLFVFDMLFTTPGRFSSTSTHDSWLLVFLRFSLVAWQHLVSCQGTPGMDGSKLLNWRNLGPSYRAVWICTAGFWDLKWDPMILSFGKFFSHSIQVCFCLTYINPTRINPIGEKNKSHGRYEFLLQI